MQSRAIRVLIEIGNAKEGLPKAEKILVVTDPLTITIEKLNWLRADIIYVSKNPTSDLIKPWAKAFFDFSHDCGQIYLVNRNIEFEKEIIAIGFKLIDDGHLYEKIIPQEPEEFGVNYLDRWGGIDFMKNWRQAGELILCHTPSNRTKENLNVLDIGCLNGYIMEALRRHGVKHIYGIDISSYLAITSCVDNYHWAAITIKNFVDNNYLDKYFDMTIALEVLEHISPSDTRHFINELRRITSDAGVILISTSEDWLIDRTHTNCRLRYDWYFQFSRAGLIPQRDQTIFPGFNNFVLKKERNRFTIVFWKMWFLFLYMLNLPSIIIHKNAKKYNIVDRVKTKREG
jgi:2-polyprenyl-3-methyl-5-hydroxy-6-metoxy-1,4-benzoquinol methylase